MAGGVAEHVAAQDVERAFEQHDHHQTEDQHVQRREPSVYQHLVHDHLEKERTDQREELQEQRDRQHLAQQAPVLDDAGDEPGEVELGEVAGEARAAGDEDQLAGPLRGKGVQRLDGRPRGLLVAGRVHEEDALAVGLGQHDDAAVVEHGQRRQRGERQSIRRRARGLGLEAEPLGGQEKIAGGRDVICSQTQGVPHRGGVGGHVMHARDEAQRAQPAVRVRRRV